MNSLDFMQTLKGGYPDGFGPSLRKKTAPFNYNPPFLKQNIILSGPKKPLALSPSPELKLWCFLKMMNKGPFFSSSNHLFPHFFIKGVKLACFPKYL